MARRRPAVAPAGRRHGRGRRVGSGASGSRSRERVRRPIHGRSPPSSAWPRSPMPPRLAGLALAGRLAMTGRRRARLRRDPRGGPDGADRAGCPRHGAGPRRALRRSRRWPRHDCLLIATIAVGVGVGRGLACDHGVEARRPVSRALRLRRSRTRDRDVRCRTRPACAREGPVSALMAGRTGSVSASSADQDALRTKTRSADPKNVLGA